MIAKKHIRFIQSQLKRDGFRPGVIDGIYGANTESALIRAGVNDAYPKKRKLAQYIQSLAKKHHVDCGEPDAFWGPQTEFAFDQLYELLELDQEPRIWRPEDIEANAINPNGWPRQTPEDSLRAFYGDVNQHQVRLELPYPHKLAWNTRQVVNSYFCHEKVHDSLKRVLTKVFEHYGPDGIRSLNLDLWGGCLNVRKMRGGNRYSMHSWGIAVDYDPEHNQYRWGADRAAFARPEYDEWWRCWESEGWVSLGRLRNFDWMHIQAAVL